MTPMRQKTMPLILALLPVTVWVPCAQGFSWFVFGANVVVWAGGQSDRFLSPTSFPPGSTVSDQLIASMGLWTIIPGGNFTYAFAHNPQDFPIDHFDGFNDTIAVPAASLDPGVLGVTTLVNNGAQWFDMDIEFSDFPNGVGWNFETNPDCTVVDDPNTFGFTFMLVATHELGHALGLGHDPIGDEPPGTAWFIATMNPRYPSGGPIGSQNIIELHTDDRNGLRFLYPGVSQNQTDLANSGYSAFGGVLGKAVPVFLTPSTALPGQEVTAQATIENFGNTAVSSVGLAFYLSTNGVVDINDTFIGELRFDFAVGDAFEFGAAFDVPDLPAGNYTLISRLDDQDEVAEQFEDNNEVVYCQPLTIDQSPPSVAPFSQEVITCDTPFVGPTPQVPFPVNMAPITWSLLNPQPGMTIDPVTGVVNWPVPITAPFVYALDIKATNAAGSFVQTLQLGVLQAPPVVNPIDDENVACGATSYTGPLPVLADECMEPSIGWSILDGPPGMQIDDVSGVVSWDPVDPAQLPANVTIRAVTDAGETETSWTLLDALRDGDLDADGDRDLADYAQLSACLNGPQSAAPNICDCADSDVDGDIDLRDFAEFMRRFDGN